MFELKEKKEGIERQHHTSTRGHMQGGGRKDCERVEGRRRE